MLVLSRRLNEAIYIGPDITVTVMRIKGDVVRIGIEAPKTIGIGRDDAKKGAKDNERND
jgi:carbon storage regulator